jgi:hypothetical protein
MILHVLHISGKRVKAMGVDGLSRGDHTEGMMSGDDPMSFLPFHLGADIRSQGRVGKWVRSWWRTKDRTSGPSQGRDWGNLPLQEIGPDNMFELKDIKAARLWMLPPAAVEVVIELLWEDKLAHPQWPHVFCVPCLMTHICGGGHQTPVGRQVGAPTVAPCVLWASPDDSHVEEGPGKECRHTFSGASGRPLLGSSPVQTTSNCCHRLSSCTRQGLHWTVGGQGNRCGPALGARPWGGVQTTYQEHQTKDGTGQ